jgi:aryl-alcohol dehydrogenase-like predicted oxidoreductase
MTSKSDFLHGHFGSRRWPVFRLGLAATYRPGERTVRCALDRGVNYLFAFAIDTNMTRVVRGMNADQREKVILATGGYNWLFGHTSLKKSLENALRRYQTDYIDVFHYLGILKPKEFPPAVQEELSALRADGKVRAIAVSCHDRKFAGELAARGAVDALMIRYNAAHPGAETDIFPHVAAHQTGVISYTATRWRRLLVRPRGWPKSEPVATAGQCYRFVLSHPNVEVALTAPSNQKQLLENLREVERGPLPEDEMAFLRRYGSYVHDHAGWFMGQ